MLVLEKAGHRPRVYIGSSTSASQGIRQRLQQYDLGILTLRYVEDAQTKGYTITHKAILCWMPKPTAAFVPVNRLLFVALEATFPYIFWAKRTTRNYGLPHICPWNRNHSEYDGLCSHCSSNEQIDGKFDLTAEQLEAHAIEKEQKRLEMKAENATNWHYKQMANDYDKYIGGAHERVAKSRANHPQRNALYQASCVKKALAEKDLSLQAL